MSVTLPVSSNVGRELIASRLDSHEVQFLLGYIQFESHARCFTRCYGGIAVRHPSEGERRTRKAIQSPLSRSNARSYSITIDHRGGAFSMIRGRGDGNVNAMRGPRYSFTVEMLLSFAFFQRSRERRMCARGSVEARPISEITLLSRPETSQTDKSGVQRCVISIRYAILFTVLLLALTRRRHTTTRT